MLAREVVVLVAGAAFHAGNTVSIQAAPHIHQVPVAIVSLAREIPPGVAVPTARVMQYFDHGLKGCGSRSIIKRSNNPLGKKIGHSMCPKNLKISHKL